MPVTSMTLSEANERQLSTRSDRITLRGKQIINVPVIGPAVGSQSITPQVFANRVAGILTYFQRWRILKLVIKLIMGSPGNNPVYAAFSDDGNPANATTVNELMEFRSSRVLTSSGADSNEFTWNPIDPNKWYYTNLEGASGDIRLVAPTTQYALSSGVTTGQAFQVSFLVFFTIEAEGAQDLVS